MEWSGSAVFEWLPRTSTIGNSSTSPPNDAIGPSLYQSIDIRQFLPQERDNTYIATYLPRWCNDFITCHMIIFIRLKHSGDESRKIGSGGAILNLSRTSIRNKRRLQAGYILFLEAKTSLFLR